MENIFEKYQKIIANGKENPEQSLKEMGVDLKNVNKEKLFEQLVEEAQKFPEILKGLETLFNTSNFKDLNNFQDYIKNKTEPTEVEKKKAQELGVIAFEKDFNSKQGFCFIEKNDCNGIIKAHSIQENGELSLISKDGKVFHFVQNMQTGVKEIKEIKKNEASIFKGFCKKHDQIFEPNDKKKNISIEESYFLYSLRSFAYSYHNIKYFKDYFLGFINKTINPLDSLIKSVQKLSGTIGLKLPDELYKLDELKITTEQLELLEIERFEGHRKLLIEYLEKKEYNQLDYIPYETNHRCPITCASWMVLHINFGSGFLMSCNEKRPYYGFPIIISVLPSDNKTKVILARFKVDDASELIFNQFKNLISSDESFEKEVSKLIIENVENFYLSPSFWEKLSEQEKEVIINAVTLDKKRFPESRTEFESINFFDKKYKINI